MTKIPLSIYVAFEIELELIRLHPAATFIRVNPSRNGFDAECIENGQHVDVSKEMTAYINRKIAGTTIN